MRDAGSRAPGPPPFVPASGVACATTSFGTTATCSRGEDDGLAFCRYDGYDRLVGYDRSKVDALARVDFAWMVERPGVPE